MATTLNDVLETIVTVAGAATPLAVGVPSLGLPLALIKTGAEIAQRLTAKDPGAEQRAAEWLATIAEWQTSSDALDAARAKHGDKAG